ncbi:MAG: hypothetical protein KGZ30_04830, partial [Anaplasmataceae bacterium]|nr:hypothetical protein [Anaplasmataceae bacterium]
YRFGLGVGAFLAFAWIVYSGFIYAWGGDNPSVRSDARDRITQALLGLLLLIGATALLNIINSRLTNLTDPILIGVRPPPPASIEDLPPGPEEGVPPGGFPEPSAEEAGNEASVRAELSAAGIPVNKGACPPGVAYQRYPGGCTSVGGVKRTTLDYAIWLKGQCGCSLTVTGGSELGHSNRGLSHSAGYKLDFGHSGSSVTAYINAELLKSDGRFKSGSRRGGINGGPRVYHNNASGQRLAEWVNEGDHWDVTVYNYPLN